MLTNMCSQRAEDVKDWAIKWYFYAHFRFAALYGIGKPYGRKPIYKDSQKCTTNDHGIEEGEKKEQLFPVFVSQEKYFVNNN
ncbi:hypothetical protein niasHT_036166 [Heterodera trifolii]|uniref:Uncharacterized protein n=1 Tax=Heterodera trifolii TaxID=157864 RepID=A0ABD2J0I5_9BILA